MRRYLVLFAAPALIAAACSGDDSEAVSTTSTTLDPVAAATAYTEAGPYPVGVTTLELDSGPLVEVWYPAVDGTSGTVDYEVRDFLPEAVSDLLTSDAPAGYEFEGARDVDVADGQFPVVLFSHGFSGFRLQSTYLTSHLATYGMVVVAPDHPSRSLTSTLTGAATGDRQESVDELLGSLDLIEAEGEVAGGRFEGHIDPGRVVALGHSAGGGTALSAALDDRVDGYVSMASGGPDDAADFPDKPSFFLAGGIDGVVPAAEATLPAYEAAPAPSRYWEVAEVGHNGFDDFCTFGNGRGIIGLAEDSGLGALLDAQPQFRSLGEDGCVPPAAPIDQALPIVRQGVTAWMLAAFGEDVVPVGLDAPVEGAFDLDVTVDSK